MAAIVKANPSLTTGGLAVLRREFSTTDDGICSYEAEYCCLAQFASNHIGKFKTGAPPPTPVPSSLNLLRLKNTPELYGFTTNTQNGLTYFRAQYSAASLENGEIIYTESEEQRNFSAVVNGYIRGDFTGFGTGTREGDVGISFDYISTTVRVEAKNPSGLPDVKGRVGRPFNMAVGKISNVEAIVIGTYRASYVETQSTSRSSRGSYTYSKSSTGIYQPTGRKSADGSNTF